EIRGAAGRNVGSKRRHHHAVGGIPATPVAHSTRSNVGSQPCYLDQRNLFQSAHSGDHRRLSWCYKSADRTWLVDDGADHASPRSASLTIFINDDQPNTTAPLPAATR